MGLRVLHHVGHLSKKRHVIPAMHGAGDNRVILFPSGVISLQMAKASELPPGETARTDDETATLRAIERMVPF
jgi:hypothetical protein